MNHENDNIVTQIRALIEEHDLVERVLTMGTRRGAGYLDELWSYHDLVERDIIRLAPSRSSRNS